MAVFFCLTNSQSAQGLLLAPGKRHAIPQDGDLFHHVDFSKTERGFKKKLKFMVIISNPNEFGQIGRIGGALTSSYIP